MISLLDGWNLQSETPSQEDYVKREGLIQRINALVASGLMQFTGMYVDTYGSYTSGLFTPQGDMDIAIEGHLQLRGGEYQGSASAFPCPAVLLEWVQTVFS